ncbi:MAG: hypothetical protein HGB12_11600 [Bacteroidetes bacterium]|nr:hypothetical protein [Bacteroidota bacterium]
MEEKIEIKIKAGLNNLKFGISMDEVKKILGDPDDTETIEDSEEPTEVWYYWENGITVFFEGENKKICVCFETDNPDATLFGKKISEIKEKEIADLCRKNGFSDFETEDEEWGEQRISINDAVMDVYFENGDLVSINWGVDYDDDGNPLFL